MTKTQYSICLGNAEVRIRELQNKVKELENTNEGLHIRINKQKEVIASQYKRIAELENDKELLTGTYNQLFKAYQELEKELEQADVVIASYELEQGE